MAPLPLRSSCSVPVVKSSRPKTFHFFCLVSAFVVWSALPTLAAAPPTGENAYCGKGNVAQFGAKDGPAELPKACYYTALDGTPSPGKQIRVAAKSDLAAAIDGAKCGDTLLLPAGASFDAKVLPSKKCDDQHYIAVRTDTPDSKLPPEGTRISPAWGGVASLPGRPPFAQPAGGPAKLLATLVVRRPSGTVVGDHIRFIGIEWTTPPDADIYRIVTAEHGDHVIFDRNWIHPADGSEVGHGVGIIGSHMIAVINSYINGLNCIARAGKCTDATAVGGGNGDEPTGTLKIYNNFLEASGENILFGGGPATVNPTDIEIRRNHLFKPIIWKEGEPGYTPTASGHPFIVKNNFELKNAQRVLLEANLLEGSWGGFSQKGFSILLTPKNQANKCPACLVNDVTIRYCRVRNVASVLQIANVLSDAGGASTDGGRYSIHDIIADDVHGKEYGSGGAFLLMIVSRPPLHDLQIDHVTAFFPGPIASILNTESKLPNFVMSNNVLYTGGLRTAFASAGGGPTACASKTQAQGPEAVLKECFSNYKFEKNLIIGDNRGRWPAGTITASSPQGAGIRDYKNGISKDPRLCHEKGPGCGKKSPGAGADDGRDLGADVDAVDAALAGVE
ncbi:MAG: hypothetical protein ABR861_14450 [Terriglobales bacterium]|jgi:hypothetical protein